MRAIVLIVLFFVMVMSIVSALSCRRLLPMFTFVVTAIEMMYDCEPLFQYCCPPVVLVYEEKNKQHTAESNHYGYSRRYNIIP